MSHAACYGERTLTLQEVDVVELKTLEAKLAKEHQAALEAAKQTQPATSQSEQATIDAAIATAVATREAEWKAGIESEIAAAVERGRVEGTTKIKLKDAQLARQMAQLKKLEAQISVLMRHLSNVVVKHESFVSGIQASSQPKEVRKISDI